MLGLLCSDWELTPRLKNWLEHNERKANNYWMLLELIDDLILQHRFQIVCRTAYLLDEALTESRNEYERGRDVS